MSDGSLCADRIYSNQGNQRLLDLLPQGRTLLDCGCGAGDNARILTSRGWKVTGITLSPKEAEMSARYCAQIIVADLERGLPVHSVQFDAVLLSHVLEHLLRPDRLLDAIKPLLAPGGVIAVGLPNVANWHVRLSLLRGRFDYAETGIMDHTHVRFYTLQSGRRFLEKSGFVVTGAFADGWPPLGPLRAWIPFRLLVRLDRWASRHLPGLCGFQNVYLAHLP